MWLKRMLQFLKKGIKDGVGLFQALVSPSVKWRVILSVQIVVTNKSKPCEVLRLGMAHRKHSASTEVATSLIVWRLRDLKQRKHLGSSSRCNHDRNSGQVLAVCCTLF